MKHITEPLDYLYEELSPEEMREARAHLAQCQQCREEMRKIRDVVRLYREAPPPAPPAGLAARAAAAALASHNRSATGPARPEETADTRPDEDYERIKQELLGEMRTGWRSWLYHPAWTVAASVIFLCAVLIHLSPRNNSDVVWEYEPPAAAVTSRSAPPPRLPEARQRRQTEATEPPQYPAPPLLREAEDALVQQERAAAPRAEKAAVPTAMMAAPMPAPAPRQVPAPAAPLAAAPTPAPESDRAVEVVSADSAASLLEPVSPRVLEQYAVDTGLADVLLMDSAPDAEPPQLIARPTPVDVQQSIRNLITLAGMQIGGGEYDEARETIALLRHHDPNQADHLVDLLAKAEKAAREQPADAEPTDKYYSPSVETTHQTPAPEPPEIPLPETPVVQLEMTDPPIVVVGEPEPDQSDSPTPPVSEPVEPVPVDAPTVPKTDPNAVPPTLWEHSSGNHDPQPIPNQPSRNFFRRDTTTPSRQALPAWRQTRRFTTDPYFREQ